MCWHSIRNPSAGSWSCCLRMITQWSVIRGHCDWILNVKLNMCPLPSLPPHIHTHTCTSQTYMHTHMQTCSPHSHITSTHAHMHIHTHTHAHPHTHTYAHPHTHPYPHTHTPTPSHTHIHIPTPSHTLTHPRAGVHSSGESLSEKVSVISVASTGSSRSSEVRPLLL